MTVITMSRNELTRLRVLIDVADGRLSVADATGLIGVGRRQIYRLLQTFRADGPDGLISRRRGGPSNVDCLDDAARHGFVVSPSDG
jgi:transposase